MGGRRVYNPDPGLGMQPGAMKIVHYTSTDLKHWKYREIARGDPVAYDSNVFRVGPTPELPDVRTSSLYTISFRINAEATAKTREIAGVCAYGCREGGCYFPRCKDETCQMERRSH